MLISISMTEGSPRIAIKRERSPKAEEGKSSSEHSGTAM